MMSILWEKIEFYQGGSNREAFVVVTGGLWGPCEPLVGSFFYYRGTGMGNSSLPSVKK